jgi:hypothetical protein
MCSFTVRRLIGAAAVVCLTASAVVVGSVVVPARTLALPGASESSVVTIEAARVADTRHNIGLTGRIAAKTPRKLTVTGLIDTYIESTNTTVLRQVVPAGATGVFLNVTVVAPSGPGFLAIRPGTATGVPATAGLNFDTGTALANGILVALPTTGSKAGQIDIYYGTPTTDASTDMIIDVVGYTTTTGLINLTKRIETLETSGITGPTGEPGASGLPVANGTSCTVADNNDGTPTMTCPDGTSVSFPTALAPIVGADCGSNFYGGGGRRLDLQNCNLTGVDLTGVDLTGVDLTGVDLTLATLTFATLTDPDLTDANLTDADLTFADLTGANLTGANLTGANLTGANLTGPNLIGANLTNAKLTFANLTFADLTNANLLYADLTFADLTGVTWSNTTCPNGSVRSTSC